jgi:hypothetical protein
MVPVRAFNHLLPVLAQAQRYLDAWLRKRRADNLRLAVSGRARRRVPPSGAKYEPHQGARERARRMR